MPRCSTSAAARLLCLGSSQALGPLEDTLPRLHALVKPDGYLLLADGYWSATPHEDYLAFLEQHPEDPDADAFRDRITAWREAYLQWGRGTLGFGLFLMKKRRMPSEAHGVSRSGLLGQRLSG